MRFSHRKQDNFEPPPIPGDISSPANAYVHVLNQQLALGATHAFSPRSLLELRLGVSRTEAGKTAFGTGTPNMLEAYGITGLPTDTEFAGGLTQQSISGWRAFGRQNSNPQHQDPFAIDLRLNQTWLMGSHSLKAGYEYQAINTEVDDVNPNDRADLWSANIRFGWLQDANTGLFIVYTDTRGLYDLIPGPQRTDRALTVKFSRIFDVLR